MPTDLNDGANDSIDSSGPPDASGGGDSSTDRGDGATDRSADDSGRTGGRFGLGDSLLVVGAGEAGQWIADVLAVEDTAFCDTNPDAARTAAEAVGGRAVEIDSEERFDLVGIAVPISATEEAIAAHAPKARRGAFDVTGTMQGPMEAMAAHAPDAERVSLHPLFAPEHAPGTVATVVDGADGRSDTDDPPHDVERVTDPGSLAADIATALRAAGNEPFVTTPEEHDLAMETVQARAHAAVLAFSLAAEPVDERFHTPVSKALAEVAARVTDGSPRTYAEIQAAFAGSEAVAEAASRIAEASGEEFCRLYREAGEEP